jgi:hypothetical protein
VAGDDVHVASPSAAPPAASTPDYFYMFPKPQP